MVSQHTVCHDTPVAEHWPRTRQGLAVKNILDFTGGRIEKFATAV